MTHPSGPGARPLREGQRLNSGNLLDECFQNADVLRTPARVQPDFNDPSAADDLQDAPSFHRVLPSAWQPEGPQIFQDFAFRRITLRIRQTWPLTRTSWSDRLRPRG